VGSAKSFTKLWIPVIVFAILIFWLSSLESPFDIKLELSGADKLVHFVEYLIFGLLLIRAINGSYPDMSIRNATLLAVAIGAFYGFTDELHQSVVPGRFSTISDFIFDVIGVLGGVVVYIKMRRQTG
jgi:hypothetical protein